MNKAEWDRILNIRAALSNPLTKHAHIKNEYQADFRYANVLGLALQPEHSETVPTACTDGRVVIFNLDFTAKHTGLQVAGLMAHEGLHYGHRDRERRHDRHHMLWNIACDLWINLYLQTIGHELPPGGCVPGQGPFAFLKPSLDITKEEYYDLIHDQVQFQPDGDGDAQGTPENPQDGSTHTFSTKSGQGSITEDIGTKEPTPLETADKITAQESAVSLAKQAGTMSNAAALEIGALGKPHVDWKQRLRNLATQWMRSKPNWMIRDRHVYQTMHTTLPTRLQKGVHRIVVCWDTSGSMFTPDEARKAAAEIIAIAHLYKTDLHLLFHDTEVAHHQHWKPGETLHLEQLRPQGGGGTSHVKVIEEANDLKPTVIILFTDMYSTFPPNSKAPCIWLCTTNNKAPFGDTIHLPQR